MSRVRVVTDLAEGQALWQQVMPRDCLADLWDIRACFQQHFQRPPAFLVAEEHGRLSGFLPLSWIEEHAYYGYFPGETWSARTWLEQNRVLASDDAVLQDLLDRCPGPYHLRYLTPSSAAPRSQQAVDEIGYLFHPPLYDYDIENYFREFSGKSAKRIKKELAAIETQGVRYRYDEPSDFDHLVRLSLGRFGANSYFHDPRFREGFRSFMSLLDEKGWLRFTTILINGEPAAIDMGCVKDGKCTLLAGGTHPGYVGVAKLINIHHMRRACSERLEQVDFLCGDFSWKKLFHLTPRPLYLLSNLHAHVLHPEPVEVGSAACV